MNPKRIKTVGELKELLKDYPDDLTIVVSACNCTDESIGRFQYPVTEVDELTEAENKFFYKSYSLDNPVKVLILY